MKPTFLAFVLALTPLALAQNLTFEAALAQANSQPAVVSAKAVLETANADLGRAKIDPMSTKPTVLKAQQGADLAQANLNQAIAQAKSQIATAYTQVLDAQMGVMVAQKGLDVAGKGVLVAQTQFKKGGGTQQAVLDAENRQQNAEQGLKVAQDGLELAITNLKSLVGEYKAIEPIAPGTLPKTPDAAIVEQIVQANPALVQTNQAVVAAQLQVDLLDPLYASVSQINLAKTGVAQAQAARDSTLRIFRIQTQSLYNQVVQATKNRAIKEDAAKNAQSQLATDSTRYKNGLISQVAFLQSDLAAAQAELAAQQARDAYLNAYYTLLAGPGTGGR
ncbi:MAG: TolC family protein [Thermaceae bacterium]|nr:TolC family protein [Thermaceae bacterium]